MITINSLKSLAREHHIRVSEEAFLYMKEFLEELAEKIAYDAVELSEYAERRTVMEKDVEFVVRKMFRDLI